MGWDAGLLDLFGVPRALLPEVRDSDAPALAASVAGAGFEAPIAAMLGDQPAALYGQGCTAPRMAALTLGTGAFVWLNAGPERPDPPEGVLATVAWQTAREGRTYALEAFGANAGNALGVLRAQRARGPGLAVAGARLGAAARRWSCRRPRASGTPHWHGADRITRGRRVERHDGRRPGARRGWPASPTRSPTPSRRRQASGGIDVLRVGGGLAADRVLLQAVADLSGLPLEVARDLEATARGIAALAAGGRGCARPGRLGPRRRPPGRRRCSTPRAGRASARAGATPSRCTCGPQASG